jgi:hypothetical protein
MSFFKKLCGGKSNNGKTHHSTRKKPIDLEVMLDGNDKPEILFKTKVVVAIGGDKEINDQNAFNTMKISSEKLQRKILEHYEWQSFGEDMDFTNFTCTMQLVRKDVADKYRPEIDAETMAASFFQALDEMDNEDNSEEQEIEEHPDLEKFKQVPWMTDLRLKNVAICLNAGFRLANSLPTEFDRKLRPTVEIAQRLNAIKALIFWLMIPEENLESDRILNFVENNNLTSFMDEDERRILKTARDDEQARNSIGWKFENAWSLAWFFGYREPSITGEMMTGEQMQEILEEFTCSLDESIEQWIHEKETLSEEKLIEKEDLFYCLHNAVRSAQYGRDTVPNGFDPVGNGGVIHERRHALTWMLSEGKAWDETDLST